jgi:hypothetical protein
MVPTGIHVLSALPLDSNGKFNRNALQMTLENASTHQLSRALPIPNNLSAMVDTAQGRVFQDTVMQDGTYKYVFICGLNRSGTTLLDRDIGKLENCTSFKNIAKMQVVEGWKLQDVYPLEFELGGPGRYGFDPRAHLTESSGLLTPENVARLRKDWHLFWDKNKTICVEKTPGNLLMTRFLQAAFPNSYFIVIKRHPVAVSMSTQRMWWKVKITSLHRLFEHWLKCYELFEEDKKHLRHVYELTYEDYVKDPARYQQEIAQFIGTRIPEEVLERPRGAQNNKYFDRWCKLLAHSACRNYYRYIARKYEPRFAKYGYSLTKGLVPAEELLRWEGEPHAAAAILYCLWADMCAFLLRFAKAKTGPKLLIEALLPRFILVRLWRIRLRQIVNKAKLFQLNVNEKFE